MSFIRLPLAWAAMFVLPNEVGSSVFRTHEQKIPLLAAETSRFF